MGRQSRSPIVLWGMRVALSVGSLAVACLLVEAASRFCYWIGYIPVTIPYSAPDRAWREQWVVRHRESGIVATYGYDQYDPRLGWSLRPNLRDYQFDNQPGVTSNSRGMRDEREFAYDKPPAVRRIVVLGDSFTFGQEAEQRYIWPARLQARLAADWEVLNMAVHGYGTDQQLLMLQQEGVRYHPDVAVVAVFVENVYRNGLAFRDYAKPLFVLREDKLVVTNVPVPTPEQIMNDARGARPWSYALHFLTRRWGRTYGSDTLDPAQLDSYLLRLTRAILQEMLATTERCEARLLVTVIPFDEFPPSRNIERSMAEWAGQSGVAFLNLRDPLERAEKETGEPMFHHHFTRAGHEVSASSVYQKLHELGWLGLGAIESFKGASDRDTRPR